MRVELKAIRSEVELRVDEDGVENLFLVFREGKEVEQTVVESEMGALLSKLLAMHQTRRHKRPSRGGQSKELGD